MALVIYPGLSCLQLSGETDIVIAKMDATANDVPQPYQVSGYVPYDRRSLTCTWSYDICEKKLCFSGKNVILLIYSFLRVS